MALVKDSATFFQHGNSAQFEYVLGLYKQALRLKADTRGNDKKAEKLMRLEEWYQNELPKLIKKRGRDAHLLHEELVQTMEWKQTRGKFYPQLSYLIKINTPRAVVMETKKAFRKLPNLEQALNALSNLKGVGITMASALLAAAAPESAPFMADECLMAIPDIEGIDYTAKEYLKFVKHIQQTMERLNLEVESSGAAAAGTDAEAAAAAASTEDSSTSAAGAAPADDAAAADTGSNSSNGGAAPAAAADTTEETSPTEPTAKEASKGKGATDGAANGATNEAAKPKKWSAHSVELALWTYYVLFDQRPELLNEMPGTNNGVAQNGGPAEANDGDEEEEEEEDEDEEDPIDEEENENGTADDDGDNDENSRNAVIESSESESNGGEVVANGKPTSTTTTTTTTKTAATGDGEEEEETSKDATDSNIVARSEDVKEPASSKAAADQSNNGSAIDSAEISSHCTGEHAGEEGATKGGGAPGESLVDSGAAHDDLVDGGGGGGGDAQPNNVSSNGNNKRSLCCDDNVDDDKPELSAPKLIKL